MDFSKFIVILLGVYIFYYALNFLYDAFIKKGERIEGDNEETLQFVDDVHEEAPITVEEPEPEIRPTQNVETKDLMENVIDMEVIDQGIPISELFKDSKELFADIAY